MHTNILIPHTSYPTVQNPTAKENLHRTDNRQSIIAYTATTEKGGEAVSADNIVLVSKEIKMSSLPMDKEQETQFCSAIKAGIYKSLHQKGLLTDAQLYQLLSTC